MSPRCSPPQGVELAAVSRQSQVRADKVQDVLGSGEAAEMAFVGHQDQLGVGQQRNRGLRVIEGDDRIGVAVPPPDGHLHVGEPEAPVTAEQACVVDQGLKTPLAASKMSSMNIASMSESANTRLSPSGMTLAKPW